ncbi:MAG: hypothetical protein GVY16_06450 [Planctomycetes bacterium]|jgi:capsular polysaccharide biosynthesis protein|nr:hypothetical protein [Phycisphaerae bacterium]NBB95365.1 hypothetical protein [Planctomycetota bacterium]
MAEIYTGRTLREIVRIIASRFIGILIIMAVVIGGVFVASYYAPKWYRSQVRLLAQPSWDPIEVGSASVREQVSLFVSTQREIVLSDYVLASALMMLEKPGEYAPQHTAIAVNGSTPELKFAGGEVDTWLGANSNLEKVRQLRERVTFETPGGPDATFTQTFSIRVDWPEKFQGEKHWGKSTDKTRQRAADQCYMLANYLVYAYRARYSHIYAERATNIRQFVEDKPLKLARDRYEDAVDEFQQFTRAPQVADDLLYITNLVHGQGNESGPAASSLVLENRIDRWNSDLAELTSLKESLDKQLSTTDYSEIVVPDAVLDSNPSVSVIQQKLTARKLDLNTLVPKYTDDYKVVSDLKHEIQLGYQDLHDELVKQRGRIMQRIEAMQAGRNQARQRLDVYTRRMQELAPLAATFKKLEDQVAATKDDFQREQSRALETNRAEDIAKDPVLVSVIDDPTRPNPADWRRPIIWLNLLVAAAGGLVLALVYAFLADHFDHTIKGVDDAERYLGTPVVASVPKLGRGIIRAR